MKIIITMAGFGKRFTDAGYNIPKYEIEVKNKTLFEWSMLSLENLKDEEFIFIKRRDERSNININDLIKKSGIFNYKIIDIDSVTDGQASTALLADPFLDPNDSVIIFNIDTFIEPHCIKKEDFNSLDGVVHTFNGRGNNWSFAKVDDENRIVDITEKVRISNNASIGLYYFRYWFLFKETLIQNKIEIKKIYKEAYIAPVYKYLLNSYVVKIVSLPKNKVHILGTPQEVLDFKSNYKEVV